jgi:hypothetical protein
MHGDDGILELTVAHSEHEGFVNVRPKIAAYVAYPIWFHTLQQENRLSCCVSLCLKTSDSA